MICEKKYLNKLIKELDLEFVYGKGRRISIKNRFPNVFCYNNLDNIYIDMKDGKIVSSAIISPISYVYENKCLNIGRLGFVYTNKSFRNKGYSKKLIEQLIEKNVDKYDGIVLWSSLTGFYSKIGFCLSDTDESFLELKNVKKLRKVCLDTDKDFVSKIIYLRSKYCGSYIDIGDDYKNIQLFVNKNFIVFGENSYIIYGKNGSSAYIIDFVGPECDLLELFGKIYYSHANIYINDLNNIFENIIKIMSLDFKKSVKKISMYLKCYKSLISKDIYIPFINRI